MPVTATSWNTYNGGGVNLTTRTTTSAVLPAGAYLSITMALTTATTGLVTVTDSAGGSWTQINITTSSLTTRTFWRRTPGTGAAITVTIATINSANCMMVGTYFTGASGSISAITSGTGTTAYPNVTTAAAVKAGDLYVANVHGTTNDTTVFTQPAGWTKGGTATFTGSSRATMQMWRAATAATTIATGVVTSVPAANPTQVSTFVVREAFSGWGIPF
jgi:hypothetical protein